MTDQSANLWTSETHVERDDLPGLSDEAIDTSRTRVITKHYVESTAAHSRSRGWIPMVKLDIYHVPMNGDGEEQITELMVDREVIKGLTLSLRVALDRADEDAARGFR